MGTRADALEGRGEFQRAYVLWQRCLAVHREAIGDDAPDTLECLAPLLYNRAVVGDKRAVAEHLPQVIRLSQATLDDPTDALAGVAGLASAVHGYLAINHVEAAEASLRSLRATIARFGQSHFSYGKLFLPPDSLASLAAALGRKAFTDARAQAEQILTDYPEALADERSRVRTYLAIACEGMADYSAATAQWSMLLDELHGGVARTAPRIRQPKDRARAARQAAEAHRPRARLQSQERLSNPSSQRITDRDSPAARPTQIRMQPTP